MPKLLFSCAAVDAEEERKFRRLYRSAGENLCSSTEGSDDLLIPS